MILRHVPRAMTTETSDCSPFLKGRSLIIGMLILLVCPWAQAAEVTFTVSETAISTAPAVTNLLYGMNVARWDHQMYPTTGTESVANADQEAITKLKAVMPGFLKYPGGNDADSYVWNSPGNEADDMDTNEFLDLASQCKAPGFITVNFNKPPELAADWLRYIKATATGTHAAPYWEVGDLSLIHI